MGEGYFVGGEVSYRKEGTMRKEAKRWLLAMAVALLVLGTLAEAA